MIDLGPYALPSLADQAKRFRRRVNKVLGFPKMTLPNIDTHVGAFVTKRIEVPVEQVVEQVKGPVRAAIRMGLC